VSLSGFSGLTESLRDLRLDVLGFSGFLGSKFSVKCPNTSCAITIALRVSSLIATILISDFNIRSLWLLGFRNVELKTQHNILGIFLEPAAVLSLKQLFALLLHYLDDSSWYG
jgi:hypothetical protein